MAHGEVKLINGKRVATPEYRSWQMMKNRTQNPRARDYKYYGGRGVTMDPRWNEFDEFLADMGRQPFKGATIERKDVNLGYFKGNCRWATRQDQSRNRSYCKLDMATAQAIRSEYANGGVRQVDLALKYNVSQAHISQVIRGAAW